MAVAAVVVAGGLGGWALLGRDDAYVEHVSAACAEAGRALLAAGSPTWEEAVIIQSDARIAALSPLSPPAEHRAAHAAILASETEAAQRARASMQAQPTMRPLDHLEAHTKPLFMLEVEQLKRFDALGASPDCPEPLVSAVPVPSGAPD